MSTKSYQLKDQATGFFDSDTRVKIVREQVVEIDTSKRMGRMTTQAIKSGRLIEVNLAPMSKQGGEESDLPEDFPSRKALIAGGVDTLTKVTAASDEELVAIKGVNAAAVEKIRAAL